ncbi:uncharacterized protein BX664DRAFT_333691 [Halteromyces radiatus]|uniref:uncharacterized protein n=1 Tax=Halteromyces radiatus TaxID=101107 RepID=UPI00221F3CC0|nr:uncharacterized protein BX664DRAFT_333691 [Halteromyces radiatus]KAI8089708.1 hypothetical protein BX664DRAFT_333691 [Halteromyces radiatus]
MGQTKSKENRLLSQKTHFSKKEINHLRHNVQSSSTNLTNSNGITEDVFKETVKKYVPSVSSHDDVFLKRLYAAFDVENNKSIDFEKFVDGLSVFMKGTPEEKLELSFKLYDVKHAGYLTRPDLERVMIQLSQAASDDDQTAEIKSMVGRMFDDLDVDDDGRLTFEEYKLSVMKEPLVVDFLEQFLAEHHLSQHPRIPSRPSSVSSYRSGRSLTHPHNKLSLAGFPSSSSPIHSSSRLSVRVSQAELLEYGHHSINSLSSGHSPTSLSTPGSPNSISPRNNHNNNNNGSPSITPRSPHHLSRPTSMTSLDAALSSMELSHADESNKAATINTNNNHHNNNRPPVVSSTTSKTKSNELNSPTGKVLTNGTQ